MKKQKIMSMPLYFVIPGDLDTVTGGYRYDQRLIRELRNLGHNVEHLALSADFPFPDRAALTSAKKLFSALPDGATVIVDGLAFGVLEDIAVSECKRLRLIALCHHPLALETGLDRKQQQRFHQSEQQALQAAQAIVVTSPGTGKVLAEQYAVPADKITVALPGTDRHAFAACDNAVPVLLTVATLTRRKAHDVLISALSSLTHLPWQARFAGGAEFDPTWSSALREQVTRLQLDTRITFVSAMDDPQAEYQGADLFVLPSRFEGYGMVFAEALAAGLPVVAARAGAVPDVVPDSAGILVPPDDVTALASALQRLLTEPELRQRLQAGAREASLRLPSWADTAGIVSRLINTVDCT